MRERRPLFGYGLQRSGMSAVYHSVCERVDFSIRFDTLWHSCGISTRQWKGYSHSPHDSKKPPLPTPHPFTAGV